MEDRAYDKIRRRSRHAATPSFFRQTKLGFQRELEKSQRETAHYALTQYTPQSVQYGSRHTKPGQPTLTLPNLVDKHGLDDKKKVDLSRAHEQEREQLRSMMERDPRLELWYDTKRIYKRELQLVREKEERYSLLCEKCIYAKDSPRAHADAIREIIRFEQEHCPFYRAVAPIEKILRDIEKEIKASYGISL